MKQYFAITLVIMAIFSMGFSSVVQAAQQQKSIIKHEQDFDKDTLKTFDRLFKDCPAGTVLYKINGELVVVCLIDSTHGIFVTHDGSQTTNIDIHVDKTNHKDKKNDNNDDGPDKSCLFDVYQSKCAPDKNNNCPDGFNMNEDGRCFPDHHEEGCPNGSHGVDDDETGQCYKDNEQDCPSGMELKDGNCTYIPEEDNTDNNPVSTEPVVTTNTEDSAQGTENVVTDNEEEQQTTEEENDK